MWVVASVRKHLWVVTEKPIIGYFVYGVSSATFSGPRLRAISS